MAEPSRYSISKNTAEISGEILKNKLEITDQEELEDAETILLSDSYEYFLDLLSKKKVKFTMQLLFDIHKYFLDPLYKWAGKIRTVDISKSGILFCSVNQIQNSLNQFEKEFYQLNFTQKETKKDLSKKLAIVHCELNAIHPFREGNGRTLRLFLDLLSINSGFDVIDFGNTIDYIKACIKGMQKDYKLMSKIIYKGLKKQ